MNKKAIVIAIQDNPIYVAEIKEFPTNKELLDLKKVAEENSNALFNNYNEILNQQEIKIATLELRVAELEKQLLIDRGELDESEDE